MKYFAVLALLGLVNQVEAIRFFDIPTEENQDDKKHFQSMVQQDTQIISEIGAKIDQAGRNVAQGELGRTLAMNKINEIKLSLSQYKENFVELSKHAINDPKGDEDHEVQPISVEKKQKDIKELSQKSEKIISFLPQIQSLEVELGLPEDTKDEELISIEKLMTTNIKNAKQSIRDQQIREAKAEEAANAPKVKEDVVGVPNE